MSALSALSALGRRPIVVAALLVSSMMFTAAAVTNRAMGLDEEARADLAAERDLLIADLTRINGRITTADALAADEQQCVNDEASRLQPVAAAPSRFDGPTVALAVATVTRVGELADSARPAATDVIIAISDDGAPSRDELLDAIDALGELRADAGRAAEQAQLAARERHAACDAAHVAVAAVIAEVGPRTDAVISASGMAPADVVAKLRGARDAVLAESDAGAGIDALPQWLAAASEVEAAHAAANAAAIDAAKHAAEQETGGGSSWSGPGPVPRVELEPPPPADWCDIEPDYVEYYDPFTGEPFYPCH